MKEQRGLAGAVEVKKERLSFARIAPAKALYGAAAIVLGALLVGLAMGPSHSGPFAVSTVASSQLNDGSADHFYLFILLDPLPRPRHLASQAVEANLKQRLSRSGFPNIGVSVSRDGAVFLAGTLRDESEKGDVVRIVRRTPGVTVVHFGDLAIRGLYGPGYLGVQTVASPSGRVVVAKVWDGSPAQMAGIRTGDTLVWFGTQRVRNPQSFHYMVMSRVEGQRVPITFDRDGQRETVMVRIGGLAALAFE
jgi:PDZ domain/BON domain